MRDYLGESLAARRRGGTSYWRRIWKKKTRVGLFSYKRFSDNNAGYLFDDGIEVGADDTLAGEALKEENSHDEEGSGEEEKFSEG